MVFLSIPLLGGSVITKSISLNLSILSSTLPLIILMLFILFSSILSFAFKQASSLTSILSISLISLLNKIDQRDTPLYKSRAWIISFLSKNFFIIL